MRHRVWVVLVLGNIHSNWPEIDNTTAEWNLWVGPVAAAEVFASGVSIHLTPLDATNQIVWTEADAGRWSASGASEGVVTGDLLQWMLDSWFRQESISGTWRRRSLRPIPIFAARGPIRVEPRSPRDLPTRRCASNLTRSGSAPWPPPSLAGDAEKPDVGSNRVRIGRGE